MIRPLIYLLLCLFASDVFAISRVYCGGYVAKSNRGDIDCQKYRIKVTTENSNSEIVSIKKYVLPIKISVDLYDPMYLHWAGIRIGDNLLIRLNNENRRLEVLKKNTEWEVNKFIDSYRVFKERSDRITLQIAINSNGSVVVRLDDKKLIVTGGHVFGKKNFHVSLLSGWKTAISWSYPSISRLIEKVQYSVSDIVEIETDKHYISGAILNSNNHLYRDESIVEVNLRKDIIRNHKPELCVFSDVYGNKVGEVKIVDAPSNGKGGYCSYYPSKRGIYTIGLGWANSVKLPKIIATFVVLPPAPDKLSKYLGVHIDGLKSDWHIETARSIGIDQIRLHDGVQTGWWTRIQPDDPNHWSWPYDRFQSDLVNYGMRSLGVLLWTPKWASADQSKNSPPKNIAQYKKYVERVVSRYRGSIYAWEIWNEPYSNYYWKGSVYDYVNLVKNASNVIKKVDPKLKVVGGVTTPFNSKWNKKLFNSDILNYIDVFSIHFSELDYSHDILTDFVNKLRSNGFKGEIWNTESRIYSQSLVGMDSSNINEQSVLYHRNSAYKLIDLILANLAAGIDKVFYYHLFNPARWGDSTAKKQNLINTGLWDRDNNPKTLVSAIAAFNYLTSDKTFFKHLKRKQADFYLFKGGESVLAIRKSSNLLDREISSCKLSTKHLKKKCRGIFYDFQGNKLNQKNGVVNMKFSTEPWYLQCSGKSAQKDIIHYITNIQCSAASL